MRGSSPRSRGSSSTCATRARKTSWSRPRSRIFELREALLEPTELIVPIADEELLDSVFGRFCIGK
ncbi:MAG: hypothetical protein U1E76_21295 [Planctomycetota bacterium]